MKRFKDISKLSNSTTGDKVNTLSPKIVTSQSTHLPPPGRIITPVGYTPPPSLSFKGSPLPEDFADRVKDAIKIAKGQMQIDEKTALTASGTLAVASYAISNLPKLNFLGPEMGKLAHFVAVSQLFSAAINLVKPKFRMWGVKLAGEEELKNILTKKYQIDKYPLVEDTITKRKDIGPKDRTVELTLKSIVEDISKGQVVDNDHWRVLDNAYSFANPDDLSRISNMLDRNDFSNKIDSWITGLLPIIAFAAPVAYIQSSINSASKESQKLGEGVKRQNPGVFTPSTPQDRQSREEARREYLKNQSRDLGPRRP